MRIRILIGKTVVRIRILIGTTVVRIASAQKVTAPYFSPAIPIGGGGEGGMGLQLTGA